MFCRRHVYNQAGSLGTFRGNREGCLGALFVTLNLGTLSKGALFACYIFEAIMFPQSFQSGFSLSSRIFAIVMVDLRQADAEENKSNRQDDNAHHGIGQSNVSISVAGNID